MDNANESVTQKLSANTYLLFLGIIMSMLNYHISVILKFVCSFIKKLTSSTQYNLKEYLADLERESAEIHMTDEFAKYARLQRKIIKIQDELNKQDLAQAEADLKHKLILRVLVGIVYILVMYMFNAQPVVLMHPDWFSPIQGLLSWPGAEPGSISFLVWCAISNSVIRTFT